ncbi:hypothetical protein [Variovorax boronicumulans]|uniref:hypothetical protein n=1 Tax=Variovorax boronicumulans TaxID=436515 RepID=UPI00085C54ED|nr:hypothetical protein [Variovorax boronicumulans]OEZ30807.1 hypothetical protein AO062_11180 [Variovorax boronicumulans]
MTSIDCPFAAGSRPRLGLDKRPFVQAMLVAAWATQVMCADLAIATEATSAAVAAHENPDGGVADGEAASDAAVVTASPDDPAATTGDPDRPGSAVYSPFASPPHGNEHPPAFAAASQKSNGGHAEMALIALISAGVAAVAVFFWLWRA